MKKRPAWIFFPESMANKLLFWRLSLSKEQNPSSNCEKSQFHHYSIEKEGGEGRGKEKKKIMIAKKNHKRKPSVKIAPETLQNCNGFLLLKLIGVAML